MCVKCVNCQRSRVLCAALRSHQHLQGSLCFLPAASSRHERLDMKPTENEEPSDPFGSYCNLSHDVVMVRDFTRALINPQETA